MRIAIAALAVAAVFAGAAGVEAKSKLPKAIRMIERGSENSASNTSEQHPKKYEARNPNAHQPVKIGVTEKELHPSLRD